MKIKAANGFARILKAEGIPWVSCYCGIGPGRLWHRLLGGQPLSMGDYVTGPGATSGATAAGGR